jgi:hypothetical protein
MASHATALIAVCFRNGPGWPTSIATSMYRFPKSQVERASLKGFFMVRKTTVGKGLPKASIA